MSALSPLLRHLIPSVHLRTVALAALFGFATFAVRATPTEIPLPRPEALTPAPVAALGCADEPAFTGFITNTYTTTPATYSTTGMARGSISDVDDDWSCTAYYRYDGLGWQRADAEGDGNFQWGTLIHSTAVPCNWVIGETTYLKANDAAHCHTSDSDHGMQLELLNWTGQLQEGLWHADSSPDAAGDFMFIHSDCTSWYEGSGMSGQRIRWNEPFGSTNVGNRPGDNCDPTILDSTGTAQTITVDGTDPVLGFDWPAAGGPALVTAAGVGVTFDATDNVAGFSDASHDWNLQRQVGTWNGSTCSGFVDDASAGGLTSGTTNAADQVASQGLADETCYRWTLAATDANGNAAATITSGSIRTSLTGNLGRQSQHTFETWDLGAGDSLAVNVASANLVISHPILELPSRGGSASLTATYNPHDPTNIGMGPGWRLDAFRRLTVNGDNTVTFTDGDGSRHTFSGPATIGSVTTYTRPPTLYATLVKDTSLTANEFVLTYRDLSTDKFDIVGSEGLLVREEDRHGNGLTIAYGGGSNRISTITDTAGSRTIAFAWDGSNRLTSITDWAVVSSGEIQVSGTANRLHRLLYDGSGRLGGWADPLNTSSTCPGTPTTNTASHLVCLGYDAAGGLATITRGQTVTTLTGGALGTAPQAATTTIGYAGLDVTTVKDAQQEADAALGTTFDHPAAGVTQIERAGTTGLSLETATRYTLLANGDLYARIGTAARRATITPSETWITTTTTWDASYPIEVATVTDDDGGALERTTTTTYVGGSLGLVARIDAPLDGTSRHHTDFTYNANNDVTQQIVSRGGDATDRTITRHCYTSSGCATTATDLVPRSTIERYVDGAKGGSNGHVEDFVTEFQYDAFGQRTRETRHNYAAGGTLLDSRATGFEYDSLGNLTKEIVNYVSGTVTNPGDDISPASTTNARTDLTTIHAYDTAGNRISTADPRRAIESAKGTGLATDDFITRSVHNALNEQLRETTPTTPGVTITQKTSSTAYDEVGQVRTATDYGGVVTATRFDRAGRALESYRDTDGAGGTAAVTTGKSGYDPSGRLLWSEDEVQATDPAGGTDPGRTETTYDALGRAVTSTEAAGSASPAIASTTAIAHDGLDRVTQQTVGTESGAAQTTKTGYDPGDRVTSVDDEFTCTTTSYDWRGLATQIVEGRTSASPCTGSGTRTINQAFDGLARMTSRAVAGGETLEASTFDGAGRATTTWSAMGTTSRVLETTFNALDEPVTEYRYTDVAGTKSAESWARANRDPAGNETDRCTWSASPTEWCHLASDTTWASPVPITRSSSRFDARNNRVEQYTPGLGATTYDPDHNYQVAGVYLPTAAGKEHQTAYAYDTRHRLDTISHVLCAATQRPCAGGNILSSAIADDYGYDANDNRAQVIEDNGAGAVTRHYCHDARNQLVGTYSAAGCSTGLLEAFAHDAAGNRTSAAGRTFTYDGESQLATCSGTACSPAFDADGRLTKVTTASGTWSYEYDGESRLVRACRAATCATGSPDKSEFTYDGESHRTQIRTYTAGTLTTTTDFRYQGDAVASEIAASGSTVVTRTFTTDEAGAIMKVTIATTPVAGADDGTYLVTWNGHGDALALSEIDPGTGLLAPAARYTYSTWGTPTISAQSGYGNLEFRYLYVGRHDVQWDDFAGAGLLYMHARHYNPEFGRFLQPDPAEVESNLYGYASARPTSAMDPSGTNSRLLDSGGFGSAFAMPATTTINWFNRVAVKSAHVVLKPANLYGGSAVTTAMRKACCTGLQGYDAGHVIAKVLGGKGGLKALNVVPIKASVNRGAMRQVEGTVKHLLQRGHRVEVRVELVYKAGHKAPIKVIYKYRIAGRGDDFTVVRFDN